MYSQIADNKRKTVVLMFVFIMFIGFIAYFAGLYYGDYTITIGALIGSFVYALFSYFASAKAALAFNGAKEIERRDEQRLYKIVENLAITEGMPTPKIYLIEDQALNAFATGRDPEHAHVAVTRGLYNSLTDSELQGVMAHELGHVKNYDIRVSMIAFGLVMVVSILSDIFLRMSFFGRNNDDDDAPAALAVFGIVALVLAPLIASLIQSAISRQREYLADATGAMTTRYPEGLASALEKIGAGGSTMKRQNASTAHLFFANPLRGGSLTALFSTHPPIEERIERLRKMGHEL